MDRPRELANYNSWWIFAIIIKCSPGVLLGCVLIIANVSFGTFGTKSEGDDPMYRYLSKGIRLTICLGEVLSISMILSPDTKLVDCNSRHTFTQYNDFCNIQNGFSAKEPVKAGFEFIAMAIRRIGALLNIFSWMNFLEWICRAGMICLYQCFHVVVLKLVETFSFCDSVLWAWRAECTESSPQYPS